MEVYRPIILNQVDTFCLWVAVANLRVKGVKCHNGAAFHLLVNDISCVRVESPDAITRFLGVITLARQGIFRAGLRPVFCDCRLEIETKLILINNDASFWVFTGFF